MTGKYFVDANVFVYMRDPREPRKQALAAKWIARLVAEEGGCTSMQILSEYYSVVTRKLARQVSAAKAWEDVRELLAWNPQPIDEALLTRAHEVEERYGTSWWDSMVVAAAQLQDCDILLTEDLQDGMRFGTVTVRNPFTMVIEEPAAEYALPRSAAVHRPRGRPRRLAARA